MGIKQLQFKYAEIMALKFYPIAKSNYTLVFISQKNKNSFETNYARQNPLCLKLVYYIVHTYSIKWYSGMGVAKTMALHPLTSEEVRTPIASRWDSLEIF